MANINDLLEGFDGDVNSIVTAINAKAKELGIKIFLDDGKKDIYVPKSRLDNEIAKTAKLRETVSELETQVKDNADAAKTVETLKTQLAESQKAFKAQTVRASVEAAVKDTLIEGMPIEDFVAMLNIDDIVVKDNGKVVGVEDAVKAIKTSKPYLFKKEDSNQGGQPNNNAFNPMAGFTRAVGNPQKGNPGNDPQYKPGQFGSLLAGNNPFGNQPQQPQGNNNPQIPVYDDGFYFNKK